MTLKWEHKNQILVMNDSQFYCFNVKSVLAKRFENFLSPLSVPVCAHTFYPSPSPKEIWRASTIFTHPQPMELAVNTVNKPGIVWTRTFGAADARYYAKLLN